MVVVFAMEITPPKTAMECVGDPIPTAERREHGMYPLVLLELEPVHHL